jgi:hypothetical protein
MNANIKKLRELAIKINQTYRQYMKQRKLIDEIDLHFENIVCALLILESKCPTNGKIVGCGLGCKMRKLDK